METIQEGDDIMYLILHKDKRYPKNNYQSFYTEDVSTVNEALNQNDEDNDYKEAIVYKIDNLQRVESIKLFAEETLARD